MKKITIEIDVPDWVDEEEVKSKVKDIAYSLSYIPADYLRDKFGVKVKEDIRLPDRFMLREKEKERLIDH